MTSVINFYNLKSSRDFGKVRLACRLVETAFKRGHKVFVATENEEQSTSYDRWLWTFSWSSFVPHAIQRGDPTILERYPVVIGHSAPPAGMKDVLVSTLDCVANYASQFDRIVDPVDAARSDLELASQRKVDYQKLTGIEPKTYRV